VLGEFPEHGDMDDEGWIDLFDFSKISFVPEEAVANHNPTKMGLDPSGEGRDKTPRAVRDEMLLRIVAEQGRSTPKSIANTTISLLYTYEKITPDEVVYDNFGVGANVGVELADAGYKCTGINSANDASDTDTFENLRAEMFRRFRNWLYAGGQLVGDEVYWEDLKMIKYKRNTKGKIQIIPKKLLLKRYGKSPDRPDAGSYCFHKMQPLAKKKLIKPPRRHINPLTGEYLPVQEKRLDEDFISPKTIDLW
jgi:hypothetical protein